MSSSFQERFKNRATLIDRFGTLDVSASAAISRPNESQLFREEVKSEFGNKEQVEILRRSYMMPQKNVTSSPEILKKSDSPPRKQAQSAKPFRALMQDSQLLASIERPAQVSLPPKEFTPYTYKDYQALKNPQYYQLGGLGPSNVGSDEWNLKKQIEIRRNEYIKLLNGSNGNFPASSARKSGQTKKNAFMNGAEQILGNRTPPNLGTFQGIDKNKTKSYV